MRIILLIALLFMISFQLSSADMVRDNLIANWSFDRRTVVGDSIIDLSGNYNAKMIGNPSIVNGKYGEAIEFNGKDNYIDMTIMKNFGTHLNNFSIDFWIKTSSTPDWTTLLKTLNDNVTMGWGIDLNRTAKPAWAYAKGTTHFYIRDNGGKALASEINSNIYDNSWHHIAWVVEDAKSNACVIYVDGKKQEIDYAVTQAPEQYIDFQYPLYIGAGNNRGKVERFCPALIDEFRVYIKALTHDEVLNNMASPASVNNINMLSSTWGNIKYR